MNLKEKKALVTGVSRGIDLAIIKKLVLNFFDSIDFEEINENMSMPEDIVNTIFQALKSNPNYHHFDIGVRPFRSMGSRT